MDISPEEILGRLRRDYPLHAKVCELQAVIARQQEEIRRLKADVSARGMADTARLVLGTKTREFVTGIAPTTHPTHQ